MQRSRTVQTLNVLRKILEVRIAVGGFPQPAHRVEPYFLDDGGVTQEIRRPVQAATPALSEDLSD